MKHKPPQGWPCPTGSECLKRFATPLDIANHLNSGRCRSGLSGLSELAGIGRQELYQIILTRNIGKIITSEDAKRLLLNGRPAATQDLAPGSSMEENSPNADDIAMALAELSLRSISKGDFDGDDTLENAMASLEQNLLDLNIESAQQLVGTLRGQGMEAQASGNMAMETDL